MKAKVINTIKHNGQTYAAGDTFEGSKEVVETLIAAGALRDKNAVEVQDDVDAQVAAANAAAEAEKVVAEAQAEATKILDEAKAEAEKVKADAQQVADDTKKAAKKVGEQMVADAKKKAESK